MNFIEMIIFDQIFHDDNKSLGIEASNTSIEL